MAKSIPYTYTDKHGTYYVRFVFPIRVRDKLPCFGRDIRRSLLTKSAVIAKQMSRRYVSSWECIIELLEMGRYRDKQFYLSLLRAKDPFKALHGVTLKTQDQHQELKLITAMDAHGNPVTLDFDDPVQEEAALTRLQGLWSQQRIDHARQLEELRTEFAVNPAKLAALNADALNAYTGQKEEGLSVEDVIDTFIRANKHRIEEQSLDELRSGLELFSHHMRGRPFSSISFDDVRCFADLLPKVPKRFGTNEKLKSMPFKEAIELSVQMEHPLLAKNTLEKKRDSVRQLLNWAYANKRFVQEDYSGALTAKYMNTSNNAEKIGYKPFTNKHLDNLLNSYLYRGPIPRRFRKVDPHNFWVPLIALFTGARLEEICQLYLQDLVEEKGIWQFRITDEDLVDEGKKVRLKNESSKRLVPVHPQLIKIGLIEYRKEFSEAKTGRLFPELSNGNQKGKYGFSVSKWFGDTLRKKIEYEKNSRYCFHSFRKNVVQNLQHMEDLPRELRKSIVGHSRGGGDVHQDYESAYDARLLDPYLSRLSYPKIDFNGISWADFKKRRELWQGGKKK